MMVFMGVSQHAEFDFDVRFARGDAHMLHPENTPEFNLKVVLSPPGVLLVIKVVCGKIPVPARGFRKRSKLDGAISRALLRRFRRHLHRWRKESQGFPTG